MHACTGNIQTHTHTHTHIKHQRDGATTWITDTMKEEGKHDLYHHDWDSLTLWGSLVTCVHVRFYNREEKNVVGQDTKAVLYVYNLRMGSFSLHVVLRVINHLTTSSILQKKQAVSGVHTFIRDFYKAS